MNKIKASQKIRVISNGVCFFTTAKQIDSGVGEFSDFNDAIRKALDGIRNHPVKTLGILGQWDGFQIQLTIIL